MISNDSDAYLNKVTSRVITISMSLAALALVLGRAEGFGIVHETDEGAAAHIWQLPMAAQLPFLAYFVLRWLPK